MDGAKFGFERLSYDNYETWKRRARQVLTREGLWSYVDGGDEKDETKKTPEWAAKNDLALQTIGYLVETPLLREIENAVTAKEAWEMLRKYFVKDSSIGKVALIKKLSKMELVEGGDMREYLQSMEDIFEKLSNVGCDMHEDIQASFVLANLPESYDNTVSAIHGRMDVLSMKFVKTKLMEEYQRRKSKFAESEKAMAVRHTPKDKQIPGSSRLCYACGSPDHLMRDCELLKKVRDEEERSKAAGKKIQALSAVAKKDDSSGDELCFAAIQEESSQDWFLDSGASVHMSGSKKFLEQSQRTPARNVKFADGQVLRSRFKGVVKLRARDVVGLATRVKLEDVLFVPGLSANLVSVSALTMKGFDVIFKKDQCCITKGDRVLLIAQKVGDLYKLNV